MSFFKKLKQIWKIIITPTTNITIEQNKTNEIKILEEPIQIFKEGCWNKYVL
jgi:hypothetical protein